ncbi:MAG: hypothetical protein O7H41_03400 [Planctomycetota bacterium]|nr:hypothetical protein [Planctomycetota bacterium]
MPQSEPAKRSGGGSRLLAAGLVLLVYLLVAVVGCSLPHRVTTTTEWTRGEPVAGHFIAGNLQKPSEGVAYLFGLAGMANGDFEGWKYFVHVRARPNNSYIYEHAQVSMEADGAIVVDQELSIVRRRRLSLRYETTSHEGSEKFSLAGREYNLGSGRIFLMDMTRDPVQVRQSAIPFAVSYRPGDYVGVKWTLKDGGKRTISKSLGWYHGHDHEHSEWPALELWEATEIPGWDPEHDYLEFLDLEMEKAMEAAVTISRRVLTEDVKGALKYVR